MRRVLPLLMLFILVGPAQMPAQQSAQSPDAGLPTLRTGTKLVVVDVVVTDKQMKPVLGLKASDFVLLENHVAQPLKSFEAHAPQPSSGPSMPPLPKGTYTNYTPFPADGPLNVLLIDALNTDPIDQSRVRQQVLDFLKQARPGTKFALFTLDTEGMKIRQGFTDNLDTLRDAVTKFKPVLNFFQHSPFDHAMGTLAQAQDGGPMLNGGGAVKSAGSSILQMKSQYTLAGVNQMARYLAGMPGRKNLLWFASRFDFDLAPGGQDFNDPFAHSPAQEEIYRATMDIMSAKEVAIYPINAQGLTMDSQAEDNIAMSMAAADTGGKAIVNSNDISGIIARDINMGSSYYTLAYTPTDPNYDGKYRNIQVKVKQQGVVLSYRHGYFADNPDRQTSQANATSTSGFSPMHMALLRGTPQPTQIVMVAHVKPANDAKEPAVAKGNVANSKLKGPFRRLSIEAAVDPRSLDFVTLPDGRRHDTLEFISFLYDMDNRLINTVTERANLNLNQPLEEIYQHGGLPLHEEISVPAKGQYFLRVGVHDLEGDMVGAVEVPVDDVRDLPTGK